MHYNITWGGGGFSAFPSRDPKFVLLNIWTAPKRWQYGRSFGPVTNQFRFWRKTPKLIFYGSMLILNSLPFSRVDWLAWNAETKEVGARGLQSKSDLYNLQPILAKYFIHDFWSKSDPCNCTLEEIAIFSICTQSQTSAVALRYLPSGCSTARSWPLSMMSDC